MRLRIKNFEFAVSLGGLWALGIFIFVAHEIIKEEAETAQFKNDVKEVLNELKNDVKKSKDK